MDSFELREPLSTRTLSTREQIIILEASKLHGCRFPPWVASPEASEFELGEAQSLFVYVRYISPLIETIGTFACLTMLETTQNSGSLKRSWHCSTGGGAQMNYFLHPVDMNRPRIPSKVHRRMTMRRQT